VEQLVQSLCDTKQGYTQVNARVAVLKCFCFLPRECSRHPSNVLKCFRLSVVEPSSADTLVQSFGFGLAPSLA
jgi:hypothetical protein